MEPDQERLQAVLSGARGIDVGTTGIAEAINEVVAAMPAVLRVSGAGLMVIDGDLQLTTLAWSDEAARVFEAVQEESGRGPCVDSLLHDMVVTVDDLQHDERWPDLGAAVVPLGVRAVVGMPVHVDGENIGSLNVYYDEPTDWPEQEIEALRAFASVLQQLLGVAVLAGRSDAVVQQLQSALESRVVIERAVGLVMGRRDIGAVDAFNLLRAASRRERRRVFEVAGEVLAGRLLDDCPSSTLHLPPPGAPARPRTCVGRRCGASAERVRTCVGRSEASLRAEPSTC
jgi:GAF domain-containing protein